MKPPFSTGRLLQLAEVHGEPHHHLPVRISTAQSEALRRKIDRDAFRDLVFHSSENGDGRLRAGRLDAGINSSRSVDWSGRTCDLKLAPAMSRPTPQSIRLIRSFHCPTPPRNLADHFHQFAKIEIENKSPGCQHSRDFLIEA